ncbi:MAG: Crp/Fnr family transcriptional regulator [Marinifilaceae bacterium]|jgi:CRP-like cAMP-binding protein|nr:Crp/Fnr family transcriptional regulator [Marinifilaceae bacterium]
MIRHIQLPTFNELTKEFSKYFKNLSESDLNLLFWEEDVHYFKRGSEIYSEGDKTRGCYFLYSGILKVFKTGTEGKAQIIKFAKSGDLIGFRSVLNQERACTSTKVVFDAVVCFIPEKSITKLIHSNSHFALELMRLTCKELDEANKFITDLSQKTVRERLAEVLIHLKNRFGIDSENSLNIILTRQELANMVGTATESVIRLLSEFRKDRLLELNGKKIILTNVKELTKLANL